MVVDGWHSWIFFWGRTDVQVDNIIYGAIAAVLFEFAEFQKLIAILVRHHIIFPICVLTYILIECLVNLNGTVVLGLLSVNPALISIVFIFLIVLRKGYMFSLLETKLLKKIGIISYSTYLWQQLFLNRSDYIPPKLAFVQSFPINMFFAFGCALLSYKFVEIPMINLGRKLSRRGRRTPGSEPDNRQSHDGGIEGFATEVK